MQAKEGAAAKKPAQGDEESINFRPSPNFKHMKKYLKSKFEEMSSNAKPPEPQPQPQLQPQPQPQPEPVKVTPVEEKPVQNKQEKPKPPPPPPPPPPPTVQPPLPPNPPPPDSPPPAIKQEIIDDEYTQYLNSAAGMGVMEDLMPQYNTEMPQAPPKDQSAGLTMCRNFVRGTCTKGASCIFVHELILDQLPGVYTFCRNFQNRQCTFARCKFVHATVFEKEYFYRTGYLPPHTLAHLKAQPPPPPPPEDTPVSLAATIPQAMQLQDMGQSYYPLNMDLNSAAMQQSMPVADMSCTALPTYMLQTPVPTVNEQHNIYGPSTSTAPTTSPLKRDWASAMEDVSYPQTDIPTDETVVKKCKDCDSIEFRYQYNKNKIENMISSSDDLAKKMSQLNAKTQRLCIVLVTLFKPQTSGLGNMTSLSERDRAILEQLNVLLSPNNRPMMGEDENSKNLPFNLHNIMTQLLMNPDQPMNLQ